MRLDETVLLMKSEIEYKTICLTTNISLKRLSLQFVYLVRNLTTKGKISDRQQEFFYNYS